MSEYILADDLSGALEAGAAFRGRGRRVSLIMNEGSADPDVHGSVSLISSETRNLPNATSAALIRPILSAQRDNGARLLLKKIDSTLRGPVGGELLVLKEELNPPLVVVCPATPSVGRTVKEGILLVDGVPVAETEFRRDPGSAVTESRVTAVLAGQGVGDLKSLPLARLREAAALDPGECVGVLVSDAESNDDLVRLVSLVRSAEPAAVFVGGGGLAHALAASDPAQASVEGPLKWDQGSVLIVSGSIKQGSRLQLERLREELCVPLLEIRLAGETGPEVLNRLAHLLAEFGSASLTIAEGVHPHDPSEPVQRLAEVVRMLSAIGETPQTLALTGGETARAVCAALEIGRLELLGEIDHGVVITHPLGSSRDVPKRIVIKPGGFGSAEIWIELIRSNRGQGMK